MQTNHTQMLSYFALMLTLVAATPCKQHYETCEECLASGPVCAWCAAPRHEFVDEKNETLSRCNRYGRLLKSCPTKHLIYTKSSVESALVSMESSFLRWLEINQITPENNSDQSPISIEPKQVKIKLRPNDPVSFNVTFKQIADYPVDLYFLMDLSNSMVDDKYRLSQLVKQLANEMKNITKDFRLGFGSFVEKPIMPFVSVNSDEKLYIFWAGLHVHVFPFSRGRSCSLEMDGATSTTATSCIPAYSFKHHLSLTDNSESFAAQVETTHVSRNIDEPEGGLDALMQVIVCEEIIGWRPYSRRLVVLSTDAGLHFAGDGKLAGIIKPNDEKCHLKLVFDKSFGRYVHEYTESLTQDYPSFGQIYAQLMEHNVNVIFGVTKRQVPLYTEIVRFLEAAVVGEVDDDSSNIVDLVAMNYKKITNRMSLMVTTADNAPVIKEGKMFVIGGGLKIVLDPECRVVKEEEEGIEREDPRCEIGIGEEIVVSVTVHADVCVNAKNVTLYPYGTKNNGLRIEIKPQCSCKCDWDTRKGKCNGHGTYSCGICHCRNGYFGRDCECDGESAAADALLQRCKRPGSNVICSGRGQCICGKCNCFRREAGEKISGEYCECDNFSCPRWNGRICSGSRILRSMAIDWLGHGSCQCDGTCSCENDWIGDDCSCTSRTESCTANSSGLICNGKGICECGSCVCDPSEEFLGSTCEECPTCERGCIDAKDCVMCMAWNSGPLDEKQCAECPYKFEMVDELPDKSPGSRVCQFTDQNGCTFFYSYFYTAQGKISLKIKKDKSCPLPLPFWLVSTVISSSILIVGILALATWRITVTIQDRQELAAFDQDTDKTKWQKGNNPIYRQASMSYGNPLYRGNKIKHEDE